MQDALAGGAAARRASATGECASRRLERAWRRRRRVQRGVEAGRRLMDGGREGVSGDVVARMISLAGNAAGYWVFCASEGVGGRRGAASSSQRRSAAGVEAVGGGGRGRGILCPSTAGRGGRNGGHDGVNDNARRPDDPAREPVAARQPVSFGFTQRAFVEGCAAFWWRLAAGDHLCDRGEGSEPHDARAAADDAGG